MLTRYSSNSLKTSLHCPLAMRVTQPPFAFMMLTSLLHSWVGFPALSRIRLQIWMRVRITAMLVWICHVQMGVKALAKRERKRRHVSTRRERTGEGSLKGEKSESRVVSGEMGGSHPYSSISLLQTRSRISTISYSLSFLFSSVSIPSIWWSISNTEVWQTLHLSLLAVAGSGRSRAKCHKSHSRSEKNFPAFRNFNSTPLRWRTTFLPPIIKTALAMQSLPCQVPLLALHWPPMC